MSEPGRLIDRRTMPAGVVPRHLQQWVLVGVASVMAGIMALSGLPAKPRSSTMPAPAALAVDPNQQRIEEYQRRVLEQAQRLTAEQAQLQDAKDSVATESRTTAATAPRERATHEVRAAHEERATHEERGRFADNVAFSRPTATPAAGPTGPPTTAHVGAVPAEAMPAPAAPVPLQAKYTVLEGTFIDTVLTNRLDGTFPGPVNCLVSVPVYASDQQHLVIPAGSRALGEARAVTTFGQSRLAVVFHRVILPNGTHIDLHGFHGLNQVGDLGLQDQVDRHYAQIFGVSLAIGAIAGLAQVQSGAGLNATAFDNYRQGAGANIAQSSARILDRFLNLLPTVTIREGHRIKVYLSNDLELPEYRDTPVATGGRP
jgi:type IV secretory pathway VirB10-like protein